MAYRLRTGDEPLPRQLHSVLLGEIDSAVAQLQEATGGNRDRSVHEARKSVKKIRALLRLVTRKIGKRSFLRLNRRFRHVGRQLSALRDSQAIVETFAALPEGAFPEPLNSFFQEQLEANRTRLPGTLGPDQVIQAAMRALQTVRPRVAALAFKGWSLPDLSPGIVATFRQGRKALMRARKDKSAENVHSLRKRVKDHWYHARLLSDVSIPLLRDRQDKLKELGTILGDAHNLHVLQCTLADNPKCRSSKRTRKSLNILKDREEELCAQALSLAGDIYQLRPRELKHELEQFVTAFATGKTKQSDTLPTAGSSRNESSITLKSA